MANTGSRSGIGRLALGFTFEYYNSASGWRKHVTLFVNPEEFTVTEPARITVTQTKGGAFVDHFGQGLKQLTIRGVTGFNPPQNVIEAFYPGQPGTTKVSGHTHFLELRKLIRDWTDKAKDPATSKDHIMRFYNWSDEEYWEVAVTQFSLLRNTGRPLLYQYNIAMTVLKDMQVKGSTTLTESDRYLSYLKQPEKRAPIIQEKLDSETSFLKGVVNKTLDITGLSSGTQVTSGLIAKGLEYYNTANSVYKTVESAISDVEQLSKDISMFIDGTTSFITKPFELVRDASLACTDVINAIGSVADVPHELIRSFREMTCAIDGLAEALFSGFTNPSLFEGASNCGTSLGIPEAPVSYYSNSFTATAQIASERQVTQTFAEGSSTLILKEEPTQVLGVYVYTDTSRTGINYLDTYAGSQVTLTSVPNLPVVIDYKVKQNTTQEYLKLQAADGVIIKSDDTIERIAYDAYGDASQWKLIVLYNNLEYPFIVEEDFDKEIEATGTVRFYRNPAVTTAITIPEGHAVWVPEFRGTNQIDFVTTEEKLLDLANTYVDVPVRASKAGEIGNAAPDQITGFTAITGIAKVSNINGCTGGKIWKVMMPGDIILIPKTEGMTNNIISGATKDYEALFGIDIALTEDGELDVANETLNDLKRVYGVKNLVQALKNRIETQKRYYIYHPEYGTDLPYYIGRKNITHWQDLVKVDLKEGVLLDPRISEIKQFLMTIDGDEIKLDFDAIPINQHTSLPIDLIV